MKLSTTREAFLSPIQQVVGVIERRQTLPVLGNVLMKLDAGRLELTGTDLEVQLITWVSVDGQEDGGITVPARKLLDIVRLLPEGSRVDLTLRQDRLHLQSGRSRFTLSTLPARDFPAFDKATHEKRVSFPGRLLKHAMEKTLFAMALQDVRYYLNGLLLEIDGSVLRTVASDGHRLALFEETAPGALAVGAYAIIPRKGAIELNRLMKDEDSEVVVELGPNSIRVLLDGMIFSSKLVEGRYADYRKVLPEETGRHVSVNRSELRAALTRVAILSNEKYRGMSLDIEPGALRLKARNPEREEAEEELSIAYQGEAFSMGFNASYLLDAVSNIDSDNAVLSFAEGNTSCVIEDGENPQVRYLVSPMRL